MDQEEAKLIKEVRESSGEAGQYKIERGILYRHYRARLLFVMPKAMRKSLVVVARDLSGHPAVDRTMANIL